MELLEGSLCRSSYGYDTQVSVFCIRFHLYTLFHTFSKEIYSTQIDSSIPTLVYSSLHTHNVKKRTVDSS
jgi:hypothetical protein